MSVLIQYVGIGIFFLGGIFFLVEAFKTSVLWGLGCIFFTPVTLFYLLCHWGNAKKPFLIQVVGFSIMFAGAFLQGSFS